jgi:hypothetical protein
MGYMREDELPEFARKSLAKIRSEQKKEDRDAR